jgi:hypothetical protein
MPASLGARSVIEENDARAATMALLSRRSPGATICPSEVAKALVARTGGEFGSRNWRGAMRVVHAAVDLLVAERLVRLTWKGRLLTMRSGPYRIARGAGD